ncbi:MAG TPA: PilZ domain-containing protein [Epsilonproteobacteria bacterium]|nr:PilZ domain-containing protein [Campylobacterota bacterium]
MQREISTIFKTLKAEKSFFSSYQNKFIDSFQNHTEKHRPGLLTKTALTNFGAKLYQLLFSFKGDPRSDLKAFTMKTITCDVDIKPIVLKSLLIMIGDFATHNLKKLNIEATSALASLVELYTQTINEAHSSTQTEPETSYHEESSGPVQPTYKEIETILELLKTLEENNETLQAMTYVEEVPIVCNVKITGQSGEFFELSTESCIASSFKDDRDVYIKHASLPKVLSGKAHHFPHRDSLRIRDPYFTDLPQEGRKFLRVATEAPIPIRVQLNSEEYTCRIKDISICGLGIISIDKLPLTTDTMAQAVFSLNGIEFSLNINIRYNIREQHFFRIGSSFDMHNEYEDLISKYVTDRQFDILKSLKSKASQ